MSNDAAKGAGLVMASLFLGAMTVIVVASRRPRPISATEVDDALSALYGPLPAGLTWSGVTWEPVSGGLGIATSPNREQAAALQRVAADVLVPVSNLGRIPVQVRQGGGFVPPAMRSVLSRPCPYGGHENGLSLDLVAPETAPSVLFQKVLDFGRFDRTVLAHDHVHVELARVPGGRRRAFVAVPNVRLLERT